MKTVNSEPVAVCGQANNVEVRLGNWRGSVNFTVVPMDDYDIVLSMEFLDRVKAVPVPSLLLTLCACACASWRREALVWFLYLEGARRLRRR